MLALGARLMGNPSMLLLDEPSLGLAPLIVREIFNVIAELKSPAWPFCWSSSNAARNCKSRLGYVLEAGELAIEGEAAALSVDPRRYRYVSRRRHYDKRIIRC
jgi:branched-chain amino acid transport system ATP-binding protein